MDCFKVDIARYEMLEIMISTLEKIQSGEITVEQALERSNDYKNALVASCIERAVELEEVQ